MEQHFGQEKMKLIKRSGQPNNGMQIRLRGEFELKQQHASKKEIVELINRLEGTYCAEDVRSGLELLLERKNKEIDGWTNTIKGKDALLKVYGDNDVEKK
jgi:hypothetical protein